METTRRNFIRTATGVSIAGLLLPSWLFPRETRAAAIDFSLFTRDWTGPRFDLSQPFLQSGSIFASDGAIAVKVGKEVLADLAGEEARLPDMGKIPFPDADSTGWAPLSRAARKVKRADIWPSACPSCSGKGRCGAGVEECECMEMDFCNVFEQTGRSCTGWIGGQDCPECSGNGYVNWALEVGDIHFAPHYIARLATLPGLEVKLGERPVRAKEIVPLPVRAKEIVPLWARFEGGTGLLMHLAK